MTSAAKEANPNIVIIEDDKDKITFLHAYLSAKFNIKEVLTSLEAALEAIELIIDLNPLAVIVDGNLSPGTDTGEDGRLVVKELRSQRKLHGLGYFIIGFSAGSEVEGADYQVPTKFIPDLEKLLLSLKPELNSFA